MARITILTVGSRGDVQPFLAIALGLIQKGHQVTLASNANFADVVTELGIPFAPIAGDFKQLLSSPNGIELLEGNQSINLINDDLRWQQFTDGWNACQGTELLIFSPLALWGYHLAEALNVPTILATSVPAVATRAFAFLQFGDRTPDDATGWLKGGLNVLSYRLIEILSWRSTHQITQKFRQEVLKLPKLPWLGARYQADRPAYLSPLPVINLYSPEVVPPPSDWTERVHQASYCFFDQADFTPPPELEAFLAEGPKPFYVGFGSMFSRDPEALAKTVIAAFAATGQRAVFCSGWGDIAQAEMPDSIYRIREVPHDWLLPQMAGAVHHGGAGTTAATLRSGIPSIVVPFFADQPMWGKCLENLGVSPGTLPRKTLTQAQLEAGIRAIVQDPSLSQRAQKLRDKIQSENGVAQVVSVMESYLSP